jgi:hypothetical protein
MLLALILLVVYKFILSENIGWIQYADGLDHLFVWVLDCTTVADLFLDSMADVIILIAWQRLVCRWSHKWQC